MCHSDSWMGPCPQQWAYTKNQNMENMASGMDFQWIFLKFVMEGATQDGIIDNLLL